MGIHRLDRRMSLVVGQYMDTLMRKSTLKMPRDEFLLWKFLMVVTSRVMFMDIEITSGIEAHNLIILRDGAHLLWHVASFIISLFHCMYQERLLRMHTQVISKKSNRILTYREHPLVLAQFKSKSIPIVLNRLTLVLPNQAN